MAEARSDEEEENVMRDSREQVVRRQPNSSGGKNKNIIITSPFQSNCHTCAESWENWHVSNQLLTPLPSININRWPRASEMGYAFRIRKPPNTCVSSIMLFLCIWSSFWSFFWAWNEPFVILWAPQYSFMNSHLCDICSIPVKSLIGLIVITSCMLHWAGLEMPVTYRDNMQNNKFW